MNNLPFPPGTAAPTDVPNPPGKIRIPLLVNLFWFSGSSGVAQLIGILYSLLLARWLLPEMYGILAGCYAAATLTSFFINWGMDTWLLRHATTHPAPLRLAGSVIKIKILLGIAWAAGLWLILTWIRPDIYWPIILAVVIFDTWVDANFNTLSVVLNATGRIRTISALIAASRSLRLASLIALAVLNVNDLLPFVIARLACTLLIFGLALLITRPQFAGDAPLPNRSIWKQALPYGFSELLAMVYGQIDVNMLAFMVGSTMVGLYAPALGLTNAFITVIGSAYIFFIPQLMHFQQQGSKQFSRKAGQMIVGFLLIGFFISLGMGLFGPRLVNLLLSKAYQPTGELLVWMSPILTLKGLSAGCAAILVAVGWQRKRLLPQAISALANFSLNLWAIPHWGMKGAAAMYVVSEFILLIGYGSWTFYFFKSGRKNEA